LAYTAYYVFCMDLKKTKKKKTGGISLNDLYNPDAVCLLRGTDLISK